eukprot:GFUD01012615.1.p1 GENE.GFUD01012615.1~~GFUD01012615.1.p1  ORF type:complete len:913 (+),score=187.69 GFUD01012615.1:372-2741(+)
MAVKDAIDKVSLEPDNVIIGVIGAAHSSVTKALAKATLGLNLPLVSYASTNKDLTKYKMFARTVWSDSVLAKAILEIMAAFNLCTIKTLGTEGSDNSRALAADLEMAGTHQQCSTVELPNIDKFGFESELEKIANHTLNSVVDGFICAISGDTKIPFLRELQKLRKKRKGQLRRLQLISTDDWDITDSLQQFQDISEILEGSITIVEDLDDDSNYEMFKFLTNVKKLDALNPWLEEFCSEAELSNCQFPNDFRIDSKVEHVMDAVVLYTKAIDKFFQDNCNRNSKICEALHGKFDGEKFFHNYMVNMEFEGYPALEGHSRISLDCNGDSIPWNTHGKYNIWQIQRDGKFKNIGAWEDNQGDNLKLLYKNSREFQIPKNPSNQKKGKVQEPDFIPLAPLQSPGQQGTKCKPQCKKDQGKTFIRRTKLDDEFFDDCCHLCEQYDQNEVVKDGKVIDCEKGSWPDTNHTNCVEIWKNGEVQNFYSSGSFPAVFLILVLTLSTMVIVGYAGFFFVKRDSNCIRKSGVQYFPFIFGGALLCQFSGIFLFIVPFNGFSCFILNLLIGFSPTMIFSAILIKTHLIHTIFIGRLDNDQSSGANLQMCPSFIERNFEGKMSMRTRQIVHVTFLLVVQFFIIVIWSSVMNDLTDIYPNNRHIRVCIADLNKYFSLHIFNFFLIFCCTLYGYLVRNVPSEYNETKFISFAMFTVCITMSAGMFIIVTINKYGIYDHNSKPYEPEVHAAIFSAVLSLVGLAVVLIMYTNKVVLILKGGEEREKLGTGSRTIEQSVVSSNQY